MARTSTLNRPASMAEIKAHAKRLAYLRSPDKILAALANEYGADRPLPSVSFLNRTIDERKPSWVEGQWRRK